MHQPPPEPRPEQIRPGNTIVFSQDELRALRECNRESFFFRCIPLGTALSVGTYYAIQNGYMKPNVRYGATPKVVVASILGYFIGKISYTSKCEEKLMALPNSQIGELLRRKKSGLYGPPGTGVELPPFPNVRVEDTYSDVETRPRNSEFDMDTDRPILNGLDDSQRPSMDNPVHESDLEPPPPPPQPGMTYDELRKKNREEYQHQRVASYRTDTPTPTKPSVPPPQPQPESEQPFRRTNKYGDTWG